MGTVYKLQKRVVFKLPEIWDDNRKSLRSEANSNASMVVQKLLESADIRTGDDMTVDVRVLIERND